MNINIRQLTASPIGYNFCFCIETFYSLRKALYNFKGSFVSFI